MTFRQHLRWATNRIRQLFNRQVRATTCGHETPSKGTVTLFGKEIEVQCLKADPQYCLDCLPHKVLQCTLCEGPIFLPRS
jgi:hypothetical protein